MPAKKLPGLASFEIYFFNPSPSITWCVVEPEQVIRFEWLLECEREERESERERVLVWFGWLCECNEKLIACQRPKRCFHC